MTEIVMPRLSDSMEEGTILRWLKSPGAEVRRGEELVEIETDKATMTYESDADGVLEIVAAEGETLAIGSVIARLSAAADPDGNGAPATAAPAPPPRAVQGTPPVVAAPVAGAEAPPAAAATPVAGERVKASPLARRIARERGVDLHGLAGSGPGGRIVRADVEQAPTLSEPADATAATSDGQQQPADHAAAKGEVTVEQLSRIQQTVARRMAAAKATVPEFTLQAEIDMERCAELRARLRELPGEAPSYNDIVVKAAALALREHPRANGSYRDGHFELHSRVNVGIAVAAPDVLSVPTIFDADRKRLAEIASEARTLAERVRAGTVTPPELSGATFTVSNLGAYGISNFTAVINPPQAAILALGAVSERAVVREGAVVARRMMAVTLACDHRILYGADAAAFLARIRELLEEPLAMLV